MSGFASKLSAAGTKGWKDLQSLWGEPKTTLTSADTSPGEKSSLLGKSSYGGEEPSKNQLLHDEDESWGEWGQDSDWASTKNSTKTTSKTSDWSPGNEDDFEAWLNDDGSSSVSTPGKSKSKKKADEDWDNWKANDSSKSSSVKSPTSSSNLRKSRIKLQQGFLHLMDGMMLTGTQDW
uniref:Uncharacterized protein n=1 Tax=Arion vulgaris TaxID=1028688 RepID=A0A0B7AR18_9EUPU